MTKEDEQPSAVVPEASPDSNEKQEAKKAPASRRKLYLLIACWALLAAALCVALPLALVDRDSSSSDSSDSIDGSMILIDTEESPAGTTTDNGDGGTETTEDTSRVGDPVDPPDGMTTDGTGVEGTATAVLDSLLQLPLFGSDITEGYDTQADLEGALRIAFRKQAQNIIDQNVKNHIQWNQYQHYQKPMENGRPMEEGEMMMEEDNMAMPQAGGTDESASFADMEVSSTAAQGGGSAGAPDGGTTDFGTNNQEENIDEADVIKADANYIYAAYGDYIVIWDTAGNQMANVQLPPIDLPEWGDPETEVGRTQTAKSSMIAPDPDYRPKPNIRSMLLTDNHLVAFVQGYNEDYSWWGGRPSQPPAPPMLYGHMACQIRVYEKDGNGGLDFVAAKDVNGNFVDARSIGDTVHLASAASVNTWQYLGNPLDWWQVANGTEITVAQYQGRATQLADAIVPKAVEKLIAELKSEDGELPSLLQINQWFTQVNETDTDTTSSAGPGFDLPYHQEYNVISNMAQVTSFDVTAELTDSGGLATSASAYMAPSYFDTLYGTDENLILATAGWDWNPFRREGEQTTYLVALEIDGASTNFVSVGTLKGHLLNSYALDIVNSELRAATTVERFPMWWGGGPIMMFDDAVDAVDLPVASSEGFGGRRHLQSELCGALPGEDDCVTEEGYEECAMLVDKGCSVIKISEDCPPTYSCSVIGEDRNGLCPPLTDLDRDDCLTNENMQSCINLSNQGCPSIMVLESCPVQFECNFQELEAMDEAGQCPTREGDGCMNDNNYIDCINLVRKGCENIAIMESCPYQFDCADGATSSTVDEPDEPLVDAMPVEPLPPPPFDDSESRTENYMVVLKLVGVDVPVGQMSEKGRVQIGEKNERITSVRFFDNVAYAVTFERTDPFYVVDMSGPTVLGELKIPGFSSYLHSMNPDNTMLLAVGQNATSDGRETGLMVTVFDASDPANPKSLVTHTFENDDNAWSGSQVQWDYKAFRYVDGKLIVPLEIWYQQEWDHQQQIYLPLPEGAENFRGFAILDINVDEAEITELFRISHLKAEDACRYCGGNVPQRSFVYNGDVMTVRDNTVVSTGFTSGEEKWRFYIEVEGEIADCCW